MKIKLNELKNIIKEMVINELERINDILEDNNFYSIEYGNGKYHITIKNKALYLGLLIKYPSVKMKKDNQGLYHIDFLYEDMTNYQELIDFLKRYYVRYSK